MNRSERRARRRSGWGRRIILTIKANGRIHEFHATKGWRSYRSWQARGKHQ